MRITGGVGDLDELQLRDPDRIFIAHARSHQPRDLAQHRIVDAAAADEPVQPIDIELRVGRALIIDQHVDGVAGRRRNRFRQPFREKRRRIVLLADQVGEQITQRRQDAVV